MSVHDAESRRARIVGALRHQVRELPRQRRYRSRARLFVSLVAAGAVVTSAALLWTFGAGGGSAGGRERPSLELRNMAGVVLLDDAAGTHQLARGTALTLPVDGQLRVEQGGNAELETGRGLSLALAESSVVSLGELGRAAQSRLQLLAGEVTCRVPRLGQAESFAVVTPSARVVVHGTVFKVRVNKSAESGSDTCVEVKEGAVIVHHAAGQVALNSGESWGCGPKSAAVPPAAERAQFERTLPPRDSGDARKASGTLEPEVRLLSAALVAERNGDKAAAEKSLLLLLRKYPQSPLSNEARGVLARIRATR